MKQIKLSVGVMALIITVLPMASVSAQDTPKGNINKSLARDEIRQTFRLAPGARVEVSSIRGSVEIETANIKVAEIHIIRSAQSRDDLEQFKIGMEDTSLGLIIRGETRQSTSGAGFGPDVRHQVILRLPRQINLSINSISGEVLIGDVAGQLLVSSVSGSLSIGAVEGEVQISGISGGLNMGQVGGQVEVRSVSSNVKIARLVGSLAVSGVTGRLTVGITKLGPRGVIIKSVSGKVELRVSGELNAELSTNSISGNLSIEVPYTVVQRRTTASAIRALIGKGGSPISINGVTSDVSIVQGI